MNKDIEYLQEALDICEFYADTEDNLNDYRDTEVQHMADIAQVSIYNLLTSIKLVDTEKNSKYISKNSPI